MKIITVSGAQSGVGKTIVAEKLLGILSGWSALKITVLHNGRCPTGKNCRACDELDSEFSIVTDRAVIEKEGTDTQRLKVAGAKQVVWLKVKSRSFPTGLKAALAKFRKAKGIIIESTSVLKYLSPDLAIFVKGKDSVLK